jgi:hypothetical protein
MTIRKHILASVAIASLAATAAIAGESTPAEKAQTRQLNTEALVYANGVPESQALPESVAPRFYDYAAVTQPSAAPATPTAQSGPGMVAMPSNSLSGLTNPPPVIANANVVSSDGITVGLVQKIQMDNAGKPTSVDVALRNVGKTVSFDAKDVSYDALDNIIISSRSSEQIMMMPGNAPRG